MRRWESKQDLCREHGGPRSECEDPEKQWFSQRTVCHVAMKQAAIDWAYDRFREKEPFHDGTFQKWSSVRSLTHPYHYRDGVHLWLAPEDLSPHDHFLESADECEVCSPSGAPVGGGLSGHEGGSDETHSADDEQGDGQHLS